MYCVLMTEEGNLISSHFTILGADDVQSRDIGTTTTDNIAQPPGASSSADVGDNGQERTNNSSPTYPRVCRNGEQFTAWQKSRNWYLMIARPRA